MSGEMDKVLDWKVKYALSEEMGDRKSPFWYGWSISLPVEDQN